MGLEGSRTLLTLRQDFSVHNEVQLKIKVIQMSLFFSFIPSRPCVCVCVCMRACVCILLKHQSDHHWYCLKGSTVETKWSGARLGLWPHTKHAKDTILNLLTPCVYSCREKNNVG